MDKKIKEGYEIMKSRFKTARWLLIFWTLFVAIGAVGGTIGMISDPTGRSMGMHEMLPYFQKLPLADVFFTDYIFPGVALFLVNGAPNIIAAVLLLAKKKSGVVCGGIFGVTLMLWICIQFYTFPANIMSTTFFIIGFLQAATGYAALVFLKQEQFTVNPEDYPNIGKNADRAVVYFSRMGYVKKAAMQEADRTGAQLIEIKSTERTEGTLGFWWCGRFGMHKWAMPIEENLPELEKYSHVTICSPVWVFSLAAPMRSFCKAASGKIKEADYIILHHMKSPFDSVAGEMDSLLKTKHTAFKSVCCRKGCCKTVKEEKEKADSLS